MSLRGPWKFDVFGTEIRYGWGDILWLIMIAVLIGIASLASVIR